ncbi:MAG: diguanylate cyclase [Bacillota bacterium]
MSDAARIKPGTIIDGRYKLVGLLGEGGMSVVFAAEDLIDNRRVAVKLLKREVTSRHVEDIIRFKKEIELACGFEHQNIVRSYAAGEYEDRPYIVMELLEGDTLSKYLGNNVNLKLADVVDIIRQIADALSYVHSKGVIHRDIKPGNIIVLQTTGRYSAKILDFGVSLAIELGEIKREREVVGTFGYMSPEATGMMNRRVDERSDLYSLGVIFYRLLTGVLPFTATEIRKMLHQQVAVVPVPPGKKNPEIPGVLEEIIMKLLAKEPELRYQDARGLLYDLERWLKGESDYIIGEKDHKVKLTYQTRLIGREQEIEKLMELNRKAAESKGCMCFIKGEEGVGKSRLVEEMRVHVYEQGGLFLCGRCLDQGGKVPYRPFRDSINDYIIRLENTTENERSKEIGRIQEVLGDLGEIIVKMNPRFGKLLRETPALVPLDPERENKRFLMVAAKFFCNLAGREGPCVLFLDDLHWADEGSLNLLEEIAGRIGGSNLLVLGTYRGNEYNGQNSLNRIRREAANKGFAFEEIKLHRLDIDDLNRMVALILGSSEEKTEGLARYLYERTGGNSFHTIEMLRGLVEEKAITWAEGQWHEDWYKIKRMPVPKNVVDIILRRMVDLPHGLKALLCTGAVMGREFETMLLYEVLDAKQEEIVRLLDEALVMQFLQESKEKGRLLFSHDKIRDAVYGKLAPEEKKDLHLRVAGAIERLNRDNLEPVFYDLAHHYTEGEDDEKALEYLLPAAEKAKDRYANDEAVKYYTAALKNLERKGQRKNREWIRAQEGLTAVFVTTGRNDEAVEIARQILSLKETPLEKAKIYRLIGNAYFKKGDWEGCEENIAKGLALLGERIPRKKIHVLLSLAAELIVHVTNSLLSRRFLRKDRSPWPKDLEIIRSYRVLNWMYILSDIHKFTHSVLRMLNIAEKRIGKSKELGMCIGGYASMCMAIPMFDRAINHHNEAIAMMRDLQDELGLAQSLQQLGYCYSWKGEYERSITVFRQAKEKHERLGDMWELGMSLMGLGIAHRYKGDLALANEYFAEYAEISRRTNNDYGLCSCGGELAILHAEKGELHSAEEWGGRSLRLSLHRKIWFIHCSTNIYLGFIQIRRGKWAEAVRYLERAKILNDRYAFLKDYTSCLYPYLAQAYIGSYIQGVSDETLGSRERKVEIRRIKHACACARKKTRPWVNHYGDALMVTARYCTLVGRNRKAEAYFKKALEQTEKIGRRLLFGRCCLEYGNFLERQNRVAEAQDHWSRARKVFSEIGAGGFLRECVGMLEKTVEEETGGERTPRERLKRERGITTVMNTSRYLSSILDLDELLEKIMDCTFEHVGAERGFLLLYPEEFEEERELEVKVIRNIKEAALENDRSEIDTNVVQLVLEKKESIITDIASGQGIGDERSANRAKSVLCAPIIVRGEVLGVVYLDNRLVSGLFSEDDLWVLDLICNQAGVSIENARLYNRAIGDGLTGLYNRVFLEDYLMRSINTAKRYGRKLSLLMIDVDNFKAFNDGYGHYAGDLALKAVSRAIKDSLRESCVAGRYGGDEVMVVLPETGLDMARMVAKRIKRVLAENPVKCRSGEETEEIYITVSIGASEFKNGMDTTMLIESADRALYRAKERGRDCVVLSDD